MMPIDIPSAHALAMQIAPDFVESGLRIVMHQPDWPAPREAAGYALTGRHYPLREYLASIGAWDSHWRPTVVFVEQPSVELLLHELSHLLPSPVALLDERPAPPPEYAVAHTTLRMAHSSRDAVERGSDPWLAHGDDYVRTLAHLIWRAKQTGYRVVPHQAFRHDHYCLSPLTHYIDRLAGEALACSHLSFAEIEQRDPPQPFTQLFRQDTARYAKEISR